MTAFNLSEEHISLIKAHYPQIKAVGGDACNLPWPDKHFDIVYSNAVIEHVGDFEKQKKMATEIMRVAKRWFVTTPNRWFPFKFHLRLSFVTWLPGHGYLLAGHIVSYNHLKRTFQWFNPPKKHLKLLSVKQLKRCFGDAGVIKHKVTFMPETLIAVNNGDQREQDGS